MSKLQYNPNKILKISNVLILLLEDSEISELSTVVQQIENHIKSNSGGGSCDLNNV